MNSLNKLVIGICFVAIVAAIGLAQPARAAAATPITIRGIVTDNNVPVGGRLIKISCAEFAFNNIVAELRTFGSGYYELVTDTDHCPLGSKVWVRSFNDQFDPDDMDGYSVATAHPLTVVNVKIGIRNLVPVPEFAPIIAVAATAVGGYMIMHVRRQNYKRQLNS